MKKKYLIYLVLPIVVFAGIAAGVAKADVRNADNPMSKLVNAIAQKFNLNVSDVQAVFDEQKAQMDTERKTQKTEMEAKQQEEFKNRINQAVTDGKLTQEQADKIIVKKAEIDGQKTTTPNTSTTPKTKEEMDAKMKAQTDSLKQWASDNNIPEEYIRFLGRGMGVGRGHGGQGFDSEKNPNGTSTQPLGDPEPGQEDNSAPVQ